jgi:hypothetical protein
MRLSRSLRLRPALLSAAAGWFRSPSGVMATRAAQRCGDVAGGKRPLTPAPPAVERPGAGEQQEQQDQDHEPGIHDDLHRPHQSVVHGAVSATPPCARTARPQRLRGRGVLTGCVPIEADVTHLPRRVQFSDGAPDSPIGADSRPCGPLPHARGSLTAALGTCASPATVSPREWSHGPRRTTSRWRPMQTSPSRRAASPHVQVDVSGFSSRRPRNPPSTTRCRCS